MALVLGGGTPYFAPLDQRIELELIETRTFGSRVSLPSLRARSTFEPVGFVVDRG
jgi:hypothetical protein